MQFVNHNLERLKSSRAENGARCFNVDPRPQSLHCRNLQCAEKATSKATSKSNLKSKPTSMNGIPAANPECIKTLA
jgi:hypothetical protein